MFFQSLKLFIFMSIVTGLIYPALITGAAHFMADKAQGSLIIKDGQVIGSSLLAQKFETAKYFKPRPSASDYGTLPSGATNFGPTSADLKKQVEERRAKWGGNETPQDLLTSSASGLDPHISPEAARFQVPGVAKARGMRSDDEKRLSALVDSLVEKRDFNILGQPRVNVLKLNLALDQMKK